MTQRSSSQEIFKSTKKPHQAAHEANQFIYEKFDSMRRLADSKNNKNAFFCYSKILRSIERYPMPLLTAQQALQLDGVGAKMAALIGNMLKKKYSNDIVNPNEVTNVNLSQITPDDDDPVDAQEILQDYNQHSQDIDLFSRLQSIENIIKNSPQGKKSQKNKETNKTHTPKFEKDIENSQTKNQTPSFGQKENYLTILDICKRQREQDDLFIPYHSLKKALTMEEVSAPSNMSSQQVYDIEFGASKSMELAPISEKDEPKSKKKKNFKPDPNTNAGIILIGLLLFENNTGKKYASKKEIKAHIKSAPQTLGNVELKGWTSMETLLKNDLVFSFTFPDDEKFSLSDQGLKAALECHDEKQKNPEGGSKMKKEKSSKASKVIPELEKSTSSFTGPMDLLESSTNGPEIIFDDDKRKLPLKVPRDIMQDGPISFDESTMTYHNLEMISSQMNSQSQQTFKMTQTLIKKEKIMKKESDENTFDSADIYAHKVLKSSIKKLDVVLYIDNREVKNKSERTFIYDKLTAMGVKCKQLNLPLGDFFWVVDVEEIIGTACKQVFTLDYIIERKTADDLAHSIMDTRYSQQKYRLKNSNIKNVFYIVEGKAGQRAPVSQQAIETAVLNTQILNGFKVRRTVNLQETIQWLSHMHYAIEAEIFKKMADKTNEYIEFVYNYDEFGIVCSKSNCLNVKMCFGHMLRCVKGCGKEAVSEILDKFDTFHQFYTYINSISGEDARMEFLGQKVKKGKKKNKIDIPDPNQVHVNKTVASHLKTLFCEKVYPKILAQDSIKFNTESAPV